MLVCVNGRERKLRKEGHQLASCVILRDGPIGVRITLGQPTIWFVFIHGKENGKCIGLSTATPMVRNSADSSASTLWWPRVSITGDISKGSGRG